MLDPAEDGYAARSGRYLPLVLAGNIFTLHKPQSFTEELRRQISCDCFFQRFERRAADDSNGISRLFFSAYVVDISVFPFF